MNSVEKLNDYIKEIDESIISYKDQRTKKETEKSNVLDICKRDVDKIDRVIESLDSRINKLEKIKTQVLKDIKKIRGRNVQ